jgi:hypothetical protein
MAQALGEPLPSEAPFKLYVEETSSDMSTSANANGLMLLVHRHNGG